MDAGYTNFAMMADTNEIIAVGRNFAEVVANADATGIWKKEPGTVAPYFYTSQYGKKIFGGWYRPGFWADQKNTA